MGFPQEIITNQSPNFTSGVLKAVSNIRDQAAPNHHLLTTNEWVGEKTEQHFEGDVALVYIKGPEEVGFVGQATPVCLKKSSSGID